MSTATESLFEDMSAIINNAEYKSKQQILQSTVLTLFLAAIKTQDTQKIDELFREPYTKQPLLVALSDPCCLPKVKIETPTHDDSALLNPLFAAMFELICCESANSEQILQGISLALFSTAVKLEDTKKIQDLFTNPQIKQHLLVAIDHTLMPSPPFTIPVSNNNIKLATFLIEIACKHSNKEHDIGLKAIEAAIYIAAIRNNVKLLRTFVQDYEHIITDKKKFAMILHSAYSSAARFNATAACKYLMQHKLLEIDSHDWKELCGAAIDTTDTSLFNQTLALVNANNANDITQLIEKSAKTNNFGMLQQVLAHCQDPQTKQAVLDHENFIDIIDSASKASDHRIFQCILNLPSKYKGLALVVAGDNAKLQQHLLVAIKDTPQDAFSEILMQCLMVACETKQHAISEELLGFANHHKVTVNLLEAISYAIYSGNAGFMQLLATAPQFDFKQLNRDEQREIAKHHISAMQIEDSDYDDAQDIVDHQDMRECTKIFINAVGKDNILRFADYSYMQQYTQVVDSVFPQLQPHSQQQLQSQQPPQLLFIANNDNDDNKDEHELSTANDHQQPGLTIIPKI